MAWRITGDFHGDVGDLRNRIERAEAQPGDNIVVVGDAGLNYWLDKTDSRRKYTLSLLPYTFYFVHGNHEARPYNVPGYRPFSGAPNTTGRLYRQEKYPNLLFVEDGIHCWEGKMVLVMGGAYSVDKSYRLATGNRWWDDEQMSPEMRKALLETTRDQHYDLVLSHTCPYLARPLDKGLSFVDPATVDSTTECFLEEIRQQITYGRWFVGHWHFDEVRSSEDGAIHFLYRNMVKVM